MRAVVILPFQHRHCFPSVTRHGRLEARPWSWRIILRDQESQPRHKEQFCCAWQKSPSPQFHRPPPASLLFLPTERKAPCPAFSAKMWWFEYFAGKLSRAVHTRESCKHCISEKQGHASMMLQITSTLCLFSFKLQIFQHVFHLYCLMTHPEWLQQQLSVSLFERQKPTNQTSPTPQNQHQAAHPAQLQRGSVTSHTWCIPAFCMPSSAIHCTPLSLTAV